MRGIRGRYGGFSTCILINGNDWLWLAKLLLCQVDFFFDPLVVRCIYSGQHENDTEDLI